MSLHYEVSVTRQGPRIYSQLDQVVRSELRNVETARETIWRMVADTTEQGIRQQLIELGWQPPKES